MTNTEHTGEIWLLVIPERKNREEVTKGKKKLLVNNDTKKSSDRTDLACTKEGGLTNSSRISGLPSKGKPFLGTENTAVNRMNKTDKNLPVLKELSFYMRKTDDTWRKM